MTNYVDSLLRRVEDPALRGLLSEAVDQLRDRKQFGLVFERHLPERVQLQNHPLRRGLQVQLREQKNSPTWTVETLAGDEVTLSRLVDGAVLRDRAGAAELVVVREFGSPIYPGLKSVGRVERGEDKPFHTVLNAENYHALETLLYAYEGKVDCIFADPPYNTGAKDWKYNNDYVDGADVYRHSKWLSFMEKRLDLAKRLLSPDGVLIVTIDEKEVHHLGTLLEQMFPKAVRQMVTIVINPLGQARKQELARVEEYAFFVLLGDSAPSGVADDLLTESKVKHGIQPVRWERLLRGGTNARRIDRPNLFYPVYLDPTTKRIVEVGDTIPLGQPRNEAANREGLATVWPLNTNGNEGRWRVSAEALRILIKQGYAKVGTYDAKNERYSILYLGRAQVARIGTGEVKVTGHDDNGVVIVAAQEGDPSSLVAKTVWNRLSHRAGEHGSALVKKMLPGRDFPFPKSLYAVTDALRIAVGNRPGALVLDFFAGSGTTGQAVMLLNREDQGARRSILVTNNEVSPEDGKRLRSQGHLPGSPQWEDQGIYRHITMPRIEAAVTGRDPRGDLISATYLDGSLMSDGLDENVEFFEMTYEDRDLIGLGRGFEAIAPLLWLKAGAVGARIDARPDGAAWMMPKDAVYGVLFDPQGWRSFVDELSDRPEVGHVFIVTDSDAVFQQVASELPAGVDATMMYEDYLSTFEINTGRKDQA